MKAAKVSSVLLVDDHAVVREGLRAILESSGDVQCLQADSAEAAIEQLDSGLSPDALLLDVSLPGMSGFEALVEVRKRFPRLPVLLISMHLEEKYAVRALRLGASGYLNKSAPSAEVLSAVRAVIAGENYLSQRFAALVARGLRKDGEQHLHESLSNREFEIFRSIGSGQSVSEIAEKLGLSVKTVSTYRERILTKMNFTSNFQIIRYVLEEGLSE
jgi:DNA-binding NarL/FixJ family response regulator